MSLNPGWLMWFMELCKTNGLTVDDAILDIGASELFCSDAPSSLNDFLSSLGARAYDDEELTRIADRSFAGDLFRRAGFRYDAVDYAKFPGIIRLDMNVDELPEKYHGRYKFINNSGTSEHILNQYNVFKIIHDAAAPGALMYHGVPGWGEYEHGIIGYSPKFFWALATANDYEIVRFWGWADNKPTPLKAEFMEQIAFTHSPIAERVWLHILLRKRTNAPFQGLNDPAFNSNWDKPAQA
ncbi:MAG TPA: hypothetical protein VGR70_08255 [Stellaceae bacterium]|nr:hypothetical protein [Stellaceae bacterium]